MKNPEGKRVAGSPKLKDYKSGEEWLKAYFGKRLKKHWR